MKRNNKIISLVTVLVMLIALCVPSFATEKVENKVTPENFVVEQVSTIDWNDPTCPWNDRTEIASSITLFDLNNHPNGYVFYMVTDGVETGYMQIHAIDGTYSLYCYAYEGECEVDCMADYWELDLSDERIYFLGSFKYLIYDGVAFVDLASNSAVLETVTELRTIESDYRTKVEETPVMIQRSVQKSTVDTVVPRGEGDDYYWPIMDDFDNLTISYNGTTHVGMHDHCSPTAATGIIRYFNHIGRTTCAAGESDDDTFEKLYIALNTNDIRFDSLGSNATGTRWDQIAVGLRWYATRNNCNLTFEQSNFNTLSSMQGHLRAGYLLQLETRDFASSGENHSVVVKGYSSNTLYVQNGWSRNTVTYSYSSLDIAQYEYIG